MGRPEVDWDVLRAAAVSAAAHAYCPYSGLQVGAAGLVIGGAGLAVGGAGQVVGGAGQVVGGTGQVVGGAGEGSRVVVGCNVENASYGLALCAECTMAGQLRLTGGGQLAAVACRAGDGRLLMPCGRCRQVLYELGGPACLVDAPGGARPLADLLPDAFGL